MEREAGGEGGGGRSFFTVTLYEVLWIIMAGPLTVPTPYIVLFLSPSQLHTSHVKSLLYQALWAQRLGCRIRKKIY
jgi:hypothetical protein